MKKRLFLFIALIMALCAILAIAVSAEEVKIKDVDGKEITVTFYDDAPVKATFANATNDFVIFNDGFACPTSYIFKESAINYGDGDGDARFRYLLDFSFLETKGKNYDYTDIVEFDFPEGVTHVTKRAFQSVTTIKKVTVPASVTTISSATFQSASNLEEFVFEHDENDSLTAIPGYMFYGCKKLKAVSLPDCVTEIKDVACFTGCNTLSAVYLSKNLEIIGSGGGGSRTGVFDDCYALYFVNEPFTTSDTAPAKPTVYYYPSTLTNISGNQSAYRECKALNNVLVYGTGVTSISNNCYYQNAPSGMTVVFLGNMTNVNTQYWGSTSKIIFANPNDKSSADVASYTNSRSALFCASEADLSKHLASPKHSSIEAATCYSNQKGVVRCFCNIKISEGEVAGTMLDTHDYVDDFDCTTANYCKNFGENKCDKFLVADAIAHNEAHDVIFANGFTSAGVHNTYCSNATCKALDKVEDLDAMFTHEGYAYKERTSGGIDTKFKINTKAMKLYEQYEGAIHFGIIIANASHFENVDVFIQNGELTSTNAKGEKTGIIVEMTSRDYDYFNCYIGGFDFANENHVGLDLIVAGYVYGENESDISFIQKQYKTDDNDATLEIPYTAMVTKGATLKAVNIVTVRDFIPLPEKIEE